MPVTRRTDGRDDPPPPVARPGPTSYPVGVHPRNVAVALAAAAMAIAAVLPPGAAAIAPAPGAVGPAAAGVDPAFTPYLADASSRLTAVLQLAAAPAVAGRGLTRAQQQAAAASIRSTQAKLERSVRADGGRVVSQYQYAYDGIKVSATGPQLARMAGLPGVVAVRSLPTYTVDNVDAVPYVGAPAAWRSAGATGRGETVAVIDTGIDYTHADFGGPGTSAAYSAIDPALVAPGAFPTSKVVAGYDFAGNAYDAAAQGSAATPVPDGNPLDCNGHGTHVAGTIAGDGVTADHATFTGPYTSSTLADPSKFAVGPGVAPEASLVALKVFGCSGSTNLIVDALEWVAQYNATHSDRIGVVNLSLGGNFGQANAPDSVAAASLVSTGVVVVAASGNVGDVPFVTSDPAAATSVISVAALDAYPTLPMASITGLGTDIPAANQNAYPGLPVTGALRVLPDGAGGIGLGCSASDYAGVAGTVVVVKRGDCPFADKGAYAAEAGAKAVVVVNRDDTNPGDLPAYFGYSPEQFVIPMVGTDRTAQAVLLAGQGTSVTIVAAGVAPNPTYRQIADFSSVGPRWADGWLKPDVTAPGADIFSALAGSGWNGTTMSGTSMATPVAAGAAALVRETHPSWAPLLVKAALSNTADASSATISGYDVRLAGSGVIQASRAVAAQVVATTSDGTASFSFGYAQLTGAYAASKTLTLTNFTGRTVDYRLSASTSLVSVQPATVRIRPHSSVRVRVRASLSRAQVAALPSADRYQTLDLAGLTALSGVVTASPVGRAAPGVLALRVPYLLVPRAVSAVATSLGPLSVLPTEATATLRFSNPGIRAGNADVYALGVTDPAGDGADGTDVRAAGVQVVPAETLTGTANPNDRALVFALNMWDRFSSASPHEYDIAIDTNGDGIADRYVVGYDQGAYATGVYNGVEVALTLDATGRVIDERYADAPANGSTLLLPTLASDLGLAAGSGPFTYQVAAVDGFTGTPDVTAWSMPFSAFTPTQSTGEFVTVKAHGSASIAAWYAAGTPVLGWMVVTLDNRNGAAQASLVTVRMLAGG